MLNFSKEDKICICSGDHRFFFFGWLTRGIYNDLFSNKANPSLLVLHGIRLECGIQFPPEYPGSCSQTRSGLGPQSPG